MFYHTSFRAWRKQVRNTVAKNIFYKKEAERKEKFETLGNKYEEAFFPGDVVKMEEVVIEVE